MIPVDHEGDKVVEKLTACQQMSDETNNRLVIEFSPYGWDWHIRCGMYSACDVTLSSTLQALLDQREKFNRMVRGEDF